MELITRRLLTAFGVFSLIALAFPVFAKNQEAQESYKHAKQLMVIADTIPGQKPSQESKESNTSVKPAQESKQAIPTVRPAVSAKVTPAIDVKVEAGQVDPAAVIKTVPPARRQIKPVAIPKVIQPKPVRVIKPKIVVKTGLH